MAKIKNMDGLSIDEINNELKNGAKFVQFQYCISIIVMTFKRGSNIYFVGSGESTAKFSIGLTLLTLILGWWGIPWGPIYTIGSLFTNLTGGKNVTEDVLAHWNSQEQ
jgi:hypothetical protein